MKNSVVFGKFREGLDPGMSIVSGLKTGLRSGIVSFSDNKEETSPILSLLLKYVTNDGFIQ